MADQLVLEDVVAIQRGVLQETALALLKLFQEVNLVRVEKQMFLVQALHVQIMGVLQGRLQKQ